ncbi:RIBONUCLEASE 1, ribonuclease 1 [Hibiscus trionum]|uniref:RIBONUCLEASE 1, ribonuclease 1 n=1 Tax=Hibiscus trionum TaxID=183268 RepID=A0A9W7LRK2_HIBTR|nr:RIBONUCLEASE 1, ribonuclease 1 [Hibiscus trionum]
MNAPVVVLVFVLMSCLLVGSQPMQPSTTTFASYLFVLQSPQGVCASTIVCKGNIPTDFTIHGLWPQDGNNRGVPSYTISNTCSTLQVVSQAKLKNTLAKSGNLKLKQQLNQAWPNLKNTNNPNLNEFFWLHEWENHGMCSDYGDNSVVYFGAAINLRNNVVSVLNFQPRTAYTVDGIANAVYTQLNGRPEVHCVTSRAANQKLLGELRLCYKKGNPTPNGIYNCTRFYSGTCNSVQESITVL